MMRMQTVSGDGYKPRGHVMHCLILRWTSVVILLLSLVSLVTSCSPLHEPDADDEYLIISRAEYSDKLEGFWLGQSIANWTGLVTEMDKIGGEGPHGNFYTRADWGKPDQPSIWSNGEPSHLSDTITWVYADTNEVWGSDDDTDIEFMYQFMLYSNSISRLTPEQIRDGWLTHIYSDSETPFKTEAGESENYLWVSNQQAFDLMSIDGMLPPATSDPAVNPHYDMIDAQLTTEIFGLFAPMSPDTALSLAFLPIRTTARREAASAAEFYVIMHSLAADVDPALSVKDQIMSLADSARTYLPDDIYPAKMYDFVSDLYQSGVPWEAARDSVYLRYQGRQEDGYDISSRNLYCNGCFASGINFASSIVSLLYGEGDFKETVKIAVLAGWDSDNPAATWGGLLGFVYGRMSLEDQFGRQFSDTFNIHRTRTNFGSNGLFSFSKMATMGIEVIDRVVENEFGGTVDRVNNVWSIPKPASSR